MRASPHSPSRGSSLSSSWDGPSPAQWKKTCCKLFFKSLTGVKLFGHFLLHLNLFDRVSCNLSVVGCCEHCRVGRRGKGWRGQGGRQHGRGQRGLDLKDEKNHCDVPSVVVHTYHTIIGEKQYLPMLRLVERTQDSNDMLCSRHPEIVGWIR